LEHLRRPHELASPTGVGPASRDPASQHPLLRLQRAAGNQAVARLVAGAAARTPVAVQREKDGREATSEILALWSFSPNDRWEIALEVFAKDITGHAWISLRQLQGVAKEMSIGFWPIHGLAGMAGAVAGPGELRAPDPHAGGADHRLTRTIDPAGFRRLIDVATEWQQGTYSIVFRNCSGFAKAAWTAATRVSGDSIDALGVRIWTPLGLALDINEQKEMEAKSKAK